MLDTLISLLLVIHILELNKGTWAVTMGTPSEPKYLTLWDSNLSKNTWQSHFSMHTAVNPMQTNNKYNCYQYACTWAKQRYKNGNHWYSLRTKILDTLIFQWTFLLSPYIFLFSQYISISTSLYLSPFFVHTTFSILSNSRVQT
jgi:hypothetical protein